MAACALRGPGLPPGRSGGAAAAPPTGSLGSPGASEGRVRGRSGATLESRRLHLLGPDAVLVGRTMRAPLGATVALLALLCGAAAEPSIPFHGDTTHSTGCAQHQAVQDRLEILEETVEKTVEHLETEMKDLLGLLEGLAWTLPPALASTPDLLGGNGQLRRLFSAGKEEGLGTGK